MQRVMIIGGPGSGKSTFARRLHSLTKLPLFHLDQLYWRPGWQLTPKDEWERLMAELAARDEWIMDGGYGNTFYIRMPKADTIVWLDLPRHVAFPRVLKRLAVGYGRVREDLAPDCPERVDCAFLKWAWTFRSAHAAKYRQALAEHASHAGVHIFVRSRAAERFLANLKP